MQTCATEAQCIDLYLEGKPWDLSTNEGSVLMRWLAACSGGDLGKGRCQTWTLALSWSSVCTGFSANISTFSSSSSASSSPLSSPSDKQPQRPKKKHWLLVVHSVPLLSVLTIKTTVKLGVNKNVMNYTNKHVIKCWWWITLISMWSNVGEHDQRVWQVWRVVLVSGVHELMSGVYEYGQWCSGADEYDEWCWRVWWVVLG